MHSFIFTKKKLMDLIISQNGYSDYKRKTLEMHDDHNEETQNQNSNVPFQSYL